MKKRLTALTLVLLLLFGVLPGAALASWDSFRGGPSNMAITDAPTPREGEAELKWAKKLGGGAWPDTVYVGVPILTDDALVVMVDTTLYKLDLATGDVLKTGEMSASAGYANAAPAYAGGKLFCALNGGVVEAFDAETLASLWTYADPLGGQDQVPVLYTENCVLTGFWSGETNAHSFVCLDAATGEKKWARSNEGGYYWAGAVAVGDAVIFGGDNGRGTGEANAPSTVWSVARDTGEVLSTLEDIPGDQRSSMAYSAEKGRVFFTTKAGYLCSAAVDPADGTLSDLKTRALGSATTATPVVYGDRVYLTAANIGFGANAVKQNFIAADADTLEILYTLPMKAYPQCSLLLSTAYLEETGKLCFYSTYNAQPGGITLIEAAPDGDTGTVTELYDAAGYEEYCICSLVCDDAGTLYYKNDSGNLLAVGKAEAGAGTMTVTVGAYDYNAVAAGLEGASESGVIFEEAVEVPAGTSAADALTAAALAAGQSVSIEEGSWGPYLTAVNALAAGTGGGYSGWTLVYNGAFPSVGLGSLTLADGDSLCVHYSVNPDMATDDVGSGEGLPTLSSFTLAGVTANMKKETTYDENWTPSTAYLIQNGEDWTALEGEGTKEAPFVIPLTLPAGTSLTALEGTYTTQLGEHYRSLAGLDGQRDYTDGLVFSLSSVYGGKTTWYQIDAAVKRPASTGGGSSRPSTPASITVTFSLFGDKAHNSDADGQVHTYQAGNLETWIAPVKITAAKGATVADVLEKALRDKGMTFVNDGGNYLESVTRSGVTLAALGNGENSGWQYTLNGKYPSQGIGRQTLADGDVVVFHYTDDYTKEKSVAASGSTSGSQGRPAEGPGDAEAPGEAPAPAPKSFADVPEDHWARTAVDFVTAKGLFAGTSEDTFSPAGTTTRGMVMTVLARLAGADTAGGGSWYEKGMDWAVQAGISDGTDPEGTITREQLAVMLCRYASSMPRWPGAAESDEDGLQGFADAGSVSSWAADAVGWCVEKGILTGKPGGLLDPWGTASRAEVAVMLERFIKATER